MAEAQFAQILASRGTPMRVPAGTVLFRPGDSCGGLLVVQEGCIRVQLVSESGRQITLYRVVPDVACVLSTQCLMAGGTYPAEGIAETEVAGSFLGARDVEALLRDDSGFRSWMFGVYGTRLTELVLLVEDLLETAIDRRLAELLLRQRDGEGRVAQTHQAIAAELGTAREVVSRHLKDFERRGAVALARGTLTVLQPEQLQRWAAGPAPR